MTLNPKTFVPPQGDILSAKYILIGEQPGYKEVRFKKPYVGPAGKELDANLQKVGITRSGDCYITNVIKDLDKPLKHYFVKPQRKDPFFTPDGLEYLRMLERELMECSDSAVIIPTGNVALFATAKRYGITKWRGSVIRPTIIPDKNRWIIPTFHPATVIPPKCQFLNKILIQHDLKKARGISDNGYSETKRDLIIQPNFTQSMEFLSQCIEVGKAGCPIFYDIETDRFNKQMVCISFGFNAERAISIPFVTGKGDYFTIGEERLIIQRIGKILEDKDIRKCGQNLVFDGSMLFRHYGIHSRNMDDTMIAQQTLMHEFKKGLDFICSIWTAIPYYKADGKEFLAGLGAWEQGWNYNAMDSIACAEAWPRQYQQLIKQQNEETYQRQVKLIEPLTFMMENGIKINVDEMTKEFQRKELEIDKAKAELDEMAGQPLNANSPKQLAHYFYTTLGHKAYKGKGKSKGPSTDEIAMKRLARKGVKEADHVLKIRRLVKLKSTYLDPQKVDSDGRMRCSYNPVGTAFSRLSSSSSIFGTGNNLQNQPHEILRYFITDDGCIFYSIDLAQAENRIVAYTGRVETMIEAFEKRLDLHSLTGALISNLPYQQVIEEDKNDVFCHLGSGDKTWRFWGKKGNHGLNYDLGYRQFALLYEIPERDGRFIVEKYHTAYPGVRNGYHAHVRQQLSNGRVVTNLYGRRTLFLDEWGDRLFKKAYSCIPQGTVGDIINERGIEYVYYDQERFAEVSLAMQVHDSMAFQIPLSVGWRRHAEILLDIKKSLEVPLVAHGREFTIPADITMGYTLYKGDMKEIKGLECPTDIDQMATLLEEKNGELNVPGINRLD